eukprot:3878652-Pyramimonas_sp.AAC.1
MATAMLSPRMSWPVFSFSAPPGPSPLSAHMPWAMIHGRPSGMPPAWASPAGPMTFRGSGLQ